MEFMCRVCETIYGLKNMFEEENEELLLMLRSVANITITADDRLPKYLCHFCSNRLQKAYDFKIQCELTDQKLRDTLEITEKKPLVRKKIVPIRPTKGFFEQNLNKKVSENVKDVSPKAEKLNTIIKTNNIKLEDEIVEINVIKDVELIKDNIAEEVEEIQPSNRISNILNDITNTKSECTNDSNAIEIVKSMFEIVASDMQFDDIIEEEYWEEDDEEIIDDPVEKICDEDKIIIKEEGEPAVGCQEEVISAPEVFVQQPSVKIEIKQEPPQDNPKPRKYKTALKEYICGLCNITFPTYAELNTHKKAHGRLRFQCNICGRSFKRSNGLKDHIQTHSGKKIPCHLCDKKCSNRGNLSRHIRQCHQKIKPFECQECGQCFARRATLNQHLASHREDRDYPCSTCGKMFKTAFYLAAHRKIHFPTGHMKRAKKGDFMYVCPHCGKKSKALPTHLTHMKIHSKVKPHACSVCPKRFHFKQSMLTHMLCHTGERPYKCDTCDKRFRQIAHLNTHTKIQHEGLRPYQCRFCKKLFTGSGTLKVHERMHTGERPFVCTMCPATFIDGKGLKKHKLSRHASESEGSNQDLQHKVDASQDGNIVVDNMNTNCGETQGNIIVYKNSSEYDETTILAQLYTGQEENIKGDIHADQESKIYDSSNYNETASSQQKAEEEHIFFYDPNVYFDNNEYAEVVEIEC